MPNRQAQTAKKLLCAESPKATPGAFVLSFKVVVGSARRYFAVRIPTHRQKQGSALNISIDDLVKSHEFNYDSSVKNKKVHIHGVAGGTFYDVASIKPCRLLQPYDLCRFDNIRTLF